MSNDRMIKYLSKIKSDEAKMIDFKKKQSKNYSSYRYKKIISNAAVFKKSNAERMRKCRQRKKALIEAIITDHDVSKIKKCTCINKNIFSFAKNFRNPQLKSLMNIVI